MIKKKLMTISSVCEDAENLNFLYILGWNTNGTDTLEDNSSVSYQVEHTLNIFLRNSFFCNLPKRIENLFHMKAYVQIFMTALFKIGPD